MKKYHASILCILMALAGSIRSVIGQSTDGLKWWDPAGTNFPVLDGQGWPGEAAGYYGRLPLRAAESVRPELWKHSRNASGLAIRFRSNAGRIVVKYDVEGPLNLPNMPTTGVSGVDLYAINADGGWLRVQGNYAFGDTIVYDFTGLSPNDSYHQMGREYRLFLPLYNSVRRMEIGVPEGNILTPLGLRSEKPMVAFGTSILQGGCASRPGMSWANILARSLDRQFINLGFSGNGELDPEIIDMMMEIPARVYILDCLPNLCKYPPEEIQRRVVAAVRKICNRWPETPVLLTDHAGYTDGPLNSVREGDFRRANAAQAKAYAALQAEGVRHLYRLTYEEIALDTEAMVDGTHPSDLGMRQYAKAYEQKLRGILDEPTGRSSTGQPRTQYREPGVYDWESRHQDLLRRNATSPPRCVFIGDSITHYWAGEPAHPLRRGAASWEKLLEPLGTRNFGFGWDRIENVLWRIYHDELNGYVAERILLNIGTNNFHLNSDEQILEGMEMLIQAIKTRQPDADLLVLGIYPRRGEEARVCRLNEKYAALAVRMNARFADPGRALLLPDGKMDATLFSDGLHPNAEGYVRLAVEMKKVTGK